MDAVTWFRMLAYLFLAVIMLQVATALRRARFALTVTAFVFGSFSAAAVCKATDLAQVSSLIFDYVMTPLLFFAALAWMQALWRLR